VAADVDSIRRKTVARNGIYKNWDETICEVGFADHQSGRFPANKVPVHKKNDDRANHRTDQTGSFAWSVPAEHLSEEGGYESANDAEDGGEDKPLRDELGDNARDKPDDDRPNDTHLAFLHGLRVQAF
jgi:hypothetical protein